MKPAFLLLLFALATSGCFGTFCAVTYVQGKITDEQQMLYEQCSIVLRNRDGKVFDEVSLKRRLRHYENSATMYESEEFGGFLTLSGLPPWTRAGSASISCVGSDQIVERNITGDGGTKDNPADLGLIVLARKR